MKVFVYTDGGSRGNPGPSAYGVILTNEDGKPIKQSSRFLGEGTNNEAEYRGLIAGLNLALEAGADEVEVIMDSQLVVHHVDGSYRLKAQHLRPLLDEALSLLKRFRSSKVVYRGRENPMTTRADELVNQELDMMALARSLRKP